MEHRSIRLCVFIVTLLAVALPASAQLSNSSLQGAYSFRYLGVVGSPCDCPVSYMGTVTFNGAGTYTITGQGVQVATSGTTGTLTAAISGTYTVYSSGMFYMDNPFTGASSGVELYGGVGQGAVVASSTESTNLDTFIAIPAATTASNATLSGTYETGSLEFAGGAIAATRNTFFSMVADGKGGLGNVSIMGSSILLNNTTPVTQTSSAATYTVTANGSGTMTFPAPSGVVAANQLLTGAKNLYVSQDGNIFIAGTPGGFDLVIGIKAMPAPVANPPVNGLYFFSELENYTDVPASQGGGFYAYYGSTNELGDKNADELAHLRVNQDGAGGAYDETANYNYTFNSAGVESIDGISIAAGGNGNYYLVAGNDGDYYLSLGVKVQPVTGAGTFLSPFGVVNAATNAPFTAQLSPGEVITLYGAGMAPAGTNASASAPFPNTLSGVGVTINGTPAPVYSVTPTQINAVVPYSLDPNATFVATVQVTNNGSLSNSVTEFLGFSSPGVFTVPPGGLGNGAILHNATGGLVSTASPAKVGEVVQIYLTGLGAVTPAVNAGAAAPSSPLSKTVNQTYVYIDGVQASVAYSGLAPGLGGLYQLNVTIPSGVTLGSVVNLEVDGVDAITIQATIPISN